MKEEINDYILKNYQNMSRREIAENLGISQDVVKTKVYRFRRQGLLDFSKSQKVLYTDEVNSFLLSNYMNYTYEKLTEMTIQKFGGKFTLRGIATQVQHLEAKFNLPRKIREKKEKGKKKRKIPMRELFSEQANNWLRENHINYHFKELTILFNEKFDTNWTQGQIARHCSQNLDLRAKQEEKKCYKCAVSRPIGSERIGTKGFIEIKTNENKWVLKHRYMWEQYHNKKIPDNHYVIFLDGNKNNFAKENLICLSDCVTGHLTDIPTNCADLKKCKIFNIKLNMILNELNK